MSTEDKHDLLDDEVEGLVMQAQKKALARGRVVMSIDSLLGRVLLQADQSGGSSMTVGLTKDAAISLGHQLIDEAERL